MRIAILLLLLLSKLATAQLVLADTNMVCKGQSVRLFVNPKLFAPDEFCLDYVGERDGLYYFGSCAQITFDAAFAFARIMQGYIATANDAAKNSFIGSRKPGYIKWLGYYQDPNSATFNDPPDASSGFVWMSGAKDGFTRWSDEEPNNFENSNPGMHVILGCSNVTPPEWCDVNKDDGHKYVAIIETKLKTVPPFPEVKILWETGSTDREIVVSPNSSRFYRVQITIDGVVHKDSIRINVPEVKADFSSYGGCGNPFFWKPKLLTNFPEKDMEITWKFGNAVIPLQNLNPKLGTAESGNVQVGVKINSLSCGQTVLDSSIGILLEYPFDSAKVFEKELKLNEIFKLNPINQKKGFQYTWTPPKGLSNANIANPEFTAIEPITYTLNIDDGFGCKNKEEFKFTIDPNIIIYIPDIFSPNNDNVNDIFEIKTNTGFYGHLRRFTIMNRWSQIIYDSTSEWKWDGKANGKDVPAGMYKYALNYEIENVPYVKSGSVILIR
ncbi:hypothetical protein EGI22_23920 [Lacihabitans sp. LS3-19]|uniref:T9SS type B sorting domain-containing protein n=1 Tax=Lacihabitans sp. LS3-19 TaxID=2487335 RepID=UPI0020CF18E9|nr:gliding motility-associated C-terminal domain-containing protein [Lacihabitans sp. LS3-19]MCP9770964.1 hypothetical protein [Lacihabitans sp. LS3-19]